MFRGCFAGVSRVFRGCFAGVSRVFRGCFAGVSRVFRGCFAGVSRVFRGCFAGVSRVFRGCFAGVSRVFRGCFAGVKMTVYCYYIFNFRTIPERMYSRLFSSPSCCYFTFFNILLEVNNLTEHEYLVGNHLVPCIMVCCMARWILLCFLVRIKFMFILFVFID